jgi:D-alanyl-D-alanine carboxypeptidase/D-alanyl-D-alanine-endopeptidase (penicillin-binding protein 4)
VHGDIVGDASAFDDKLVPDGWKTSYLGSAYAARVSALSLNENVVWVVVQPNGKKAQVTLDPASTVLPLESSVTVSGGTGGRISAMRRVDGTIVVRGTVGARSGPLRYSLVVPDPALFTTGALRASLAKVGIVVDGQTRVGQPPATATQIAAVTSPPLAQIIGEMDRESINVVAELLFRAAAHAATNQQGSAETGLANLREFLSKKVGTRPNVVNVADGSGLSLNDSVTARSMVRLLGYVHQAEWGPVFHAALPVEGESGTLKRHGKGAPSRGNLHAKTGTTNTVAALGGYVTARNGEVLAFSLIYNGADRWNAKAAMDQIGATMAEFTRE